MKQFRCGCFHHRTNEPGHRTVSPVQLRREFLLEVQAVPVSNWRLGLPSAPPRAPVRVN